MVEAGRVNVGNLRPTASHMRLKASEKLLYATDKNILRFWERVKVGQVDECWEWVGTMIHGYGTYNMRDPSRFPREAVWRAHRWAYALTYGADGMDGYDVAHQCHNSKCCNPNHLELQTPLQNAQARVAAGRQKTGVEDRKCFSDDDVRKIRDGAANGLTHKRQSEMWGITEVMVAHIVKRRCYKNVPDAVMVAISYDEMARVLRTIKSIHGDACLCEAIEKPCASRGMRQRLLGLSTVRKGVSGSLCAVVLEIGGVEWQSQ